MSIKAYQFHRQMFYLWGVILGAMSAYEWIFTIIQPAITIGMSGAVSMTVLMWIGGLALFGLGALIERPTNDVQAQAAATHPGWETPTRPMPERADRNTSKTPLVDWSDDHTRPRLGDHTFATPTAPRRHADREYIVHGDGRVLSDVDGQTHTWRSEAGFKEWADKNAPKPV